MSTIVLDTPIPCEEFPFYGNAENGYKLADQCYESFPPHMPREDFLKRIKHTLHNRQTYLDRHRKAAAKLERDVDWLTKKLESLGFTEEEITGKKPETPV